MAQSSTTAVQAAPLYMYSFMAILYLVAFECLYVLQIVGIHHLTVRKVWFGLCAHEYAYVHRAIVFSYVGEPDIFHKPSTKSLDDIVHLSDRLAQQSLTYVTYPPDVIEYQSVIRSMFPLRGLDLYY